MLEVKNLTISIENRYIVKDLNFTLNKNDKLAIIGEEGNGKSTILKAILGICDYAKVTGTINKKNNKIGYLSQTIKENRPKETVQQYLFKNEEDYYNKINELYNYIKKLKLKDELLNQTISTLSGGEKVKICILKLLLEQNDILLLDEPTNDLDIETLNWLEQFITTSQQPIIYVSHDETLLSRTANTILHIEQLKKKTECKHTYIKTNYETYVDERIRKINKQEQIAQYEKNKYNTQKQKLLQVMQKVEYQQNTISRADPHGAALLKKKMHALKSQEKKLNEIEITETPDVEENINIFFEPVTIPKNKNIINIHIQELKVENKILSKNINLEIIGNKHICIIGKNGAGKTTLIKQIYNELKSRKDIIVGYMPQNYEEELQKYNKVLDYLAPSKSKEDITKAMTLLGNLKFTKEEMKENISTISNGSKAKLIFAKLILNKSNVLILDEPTRNTSPLSNPVIRKMLRKFKGTIISISHDRKYIEEVIDDIYQLDQNGIIKIKEFKQGEIWKY